MSALGHWRTLASELGMSALRLKADVRRARSKSPLCANSGPGEGHSMLEADFELVVVVNFDLQHPKSRTLRL